MTGLRQAPTAFRDIFTGNEVATSLETELRPTTDGSTLRVYSLKYHLTTVVKVYQYSDLEQGIIVHEIELRTDGWETPTTKNRINAMLRALGLGLGYGVYQHKHEWYLSTPTKDLSFHDGMLLLHERTEKHPRANFQALHEATNRFYRVLDGKPIVDDWPDVD